MNLVWEPEPRAELIAAAERYEQKREGLSVRFLDAVGRTVSAIQESPRRFAAVTEPALRWDVRRALVRDFPYSVVFVITERALVVIAVAHARRRAGYWRPRARRASKH